MIETISPFGMVSVTSCKCGDVAFAFEVSRHAIELDDSGGGDAPGLGRSTRKW